RMSLSNSGAFGVCGAGKLLSLAVEVSGDGDSSISQVPHRSEGTSATISSAAPWERGGNGGAAVLRFETFEDAYWARQVLHNLDVGGRQIYCGFPPWRP
ncbi:unnamed protein product, partial [Polarella glacialis]